jgi:hypothetical protein
MNCAKKMNFPMMVAGLGKFYRGLPRSEDITDTATFNLHKDVAKHEKNIKICDRIFRSSERVV